MKRFLVSVKLNGRFTSVKSVDVIAMMMIPVLTIKQRGAIMNSLSHFVSVFFFLSIFGFIFLALVHFMCALRGLELVF